MLPLLIFLYIKKHRYHFTAELNLLISSKSFIIKCIIFLMLALVIGEIAFSQIRNYQYEIKKGESSIGAIVLTHTITGTANTVSLISNIKYRFVFLFTILSKEQVIFDNGIMTYSSVYREQNGDKKICQQTKKVAPNYVIAKDDNKKTELNIHEINYQTLCLYITEPLLYQKVYIDKFQQLVAIQKISTHVYKVVFPDGNYNEYYYQDGVCNLVKVHQSLFNVQIELIKTF